jgi:hypothetical protein
MKKIIFITLLTTLLFSSNPAVYSALGDIIYNNASGIEKLGKIEEYADYKEKIQQYIAEVDTTKRTGFLIEKGDKKIDKKSYLNNLRKFSKSNDFFIRSARNNFTKAMEEENSKLFSQLVNTGLIDTQKYKNDIVTYYLFHMNEINPQGAIQDILDNDEALKNKKTKKRVYKSKKQREKEKIRRIRENDKKRQAAIERKLQENVNRKKSEIIDYQKKELAN